MSPKDYLSQARTLARAISRKWEQLAEIQAIAYRATGSYNAVRISGTSRKSKIDDSVDKIVDLKKKLKLALARYEQAYSEISDAIDAVDNPIYREILELRYLQYKEFYEIAEIMNYSYRHTTRLHGHALERVVVPRCP